MSVCMPSHSSWRSPYFTGSASGASVLQILPTTEWPRRASPIQPVQAEIRLFTGTEVWHTCSLFTGMIKIQSKLQNMPYVRHCVYRESKVIQKASVITVLSASGSFKGKGGCKGGINSWFWLSIKSLSTESLKKEQIYKSSSHTSE